MTAAKYKSSVKCEQSGEKPNARIYGIYVCMYVRRGMWNNWPVDWLTYWYSDNLPPACACVGSIKNDLQLIPYGHFVARFFLVLNLLPPTGHQTNANEKQHVAHTYRATLVCVCVSGNMCLYEPLAGVVAVTASQLMQISTSHPTMLTFLSFSVGLTY